MRSRYSAFVMNDTAYLLETWHASTRPASLELDREPATRWLGLEVLGSMAGSGNDPAETVEFIAYFKVGGRQARLHEVSRFVRQDGRWFYVDGTSPREAN
jgi:SEC-C motif-containing protein